MKFVVCVDDRMGMMFNKRRQSKDTRLIENLAELTSGAKIFVSPYSESLFAGISDVVVSENPTEFAGENEFVFIEDKKPHHLKEVSQLIIYKWNRHYPSDTFFDVDMSEFVLKDTMDFEGTSHKTITREVYTKE